MKSLLNKINLGPVLWILLCVVLGTIGWMIHNPELYQPWWVWALGTIFFETIVVAGVLLLSSLIGSIMFVDDYIEEWFVKILTVIIFICINVFMGINLWETWN